MNVTVWWQADNWKKVLWYEINWEVGETRYRQDVVRGEGKWTIYEFDFAKKRFFFPIDFNCDRVQGTTTQ